MTFREFCIKNKACGPGLNWLGDRTPEQFWRDCENPAWFLWVPLAVLLPEQVRCGYIAADLAVRKYAPAALEAAGLHEYAAKLRALPEIVDAETARAAEAAASRADAAAEAAAEVAAAEAAWAAARAAWAAARAAEAAADAAARAAWVGARAAAAAGAEMLTLFREVITLEKFLAACESAGVK